MAKTKEEIEAEQRKAEEERKKKEDEEAAKLAEITKDPDAIRALLEAKRKANDEAKQLRLKLEAFETKEKEAERKALEEQGKYKDLADKERQEKETLKANFRNGLIASALKFEAERAGIIDLDALALIDRSAVTVSDDLNEISGAKEAIETLKVKKSYLFAKPQGEGEPAPGSPKPSYMRGGGGTADGLTPEQRIDKWYKENPTKLKS